MGIVGKSLSANKAARKKIRKVCGNCKYRMDSGSLPDNYTYCPIKNKSYTLNHEACDYFKNKLELP